MLFLRLISQALPRQQMSARGLGRASSGKASLHPRTCAQRGAQARKKGRNAEILRRGGRVTAGGAREELGRRRRREEQGRSKARVRRAKRPRGGSPVCLFFIRSYTCLYADVYLHVHLTAHTQIIEGTPPNEMKMAFLHGGIRSPLKRTIDTAFDTTPPETRINTRLLQMIIIYYCSYTISSTQTLVYKV